MPAFNYTIDVMTNNGQQTLITIIMIDTIQLCGNTAWNSPNQPQFATKKLEKDSNMNWSELEALLSRVAATSVPYILVAGHFPVWSIGSHGPTKCLVDRLRPLLHKYGISAYLCGHEHNLQLIRDSYLNHTVNYVVSGCSSFNDPIRAHVKDVPANSLKFDWTDWSLLFNGGLIVVQADAINMNLTFYSTAGQSLYMTTIKPRF